MHTYKMDETNRQEVIGELQKKLELVEQAICRLSYSRNCVESNASMMKATVLRDISDVLATLRSREVSLLRQIDLMEAHHLNILHTQYAEVHQILGNLKHVLYCVEQQEDGHAHTFSNSDMELVATVLKQKVPCDPITYSRDFNELNTTIQHFGAVATNLSALQATKELVSKCLPAKLEEYDDGDQQLLYKTLEEVKEKTESVSKHCLQFPKLSDNKEDWLRECSSLPYAQVSSTKAGFSLPDCFLQTDWSYWLKQASTCTNPLLPVHCPKETKVEEWLHRHTDAQTQCNGEKMESVEGHVRDDRCSSVASESIDMISPPETLASNEFCHVQKEELSDCYQTKNLNMYPCSQMCPSDISRDTHLAEQKRKWWWLYVEARDGKTREEIIRAEKGLACCANKPCGSRCKCVCKKESIDRAIEMQAAVVKNSNFIVESKAECEAEKVDLSEKTLKTDAREKSNPMPGFSNSLSSRLTSTTLDPSKNDFDSHCIGATLQAYLLPINVNAWVMPDKA